MHVLKQNTAYLACLLFALTAAAGLQAQTGQGNFELQGTLKEMPVMPSRIYLVYDSLDPHPADSASVINGKYSFRGSISNPALAYITPVMYNSKDQNDARSLGRSEYITPVFIEKGKLTVVSTKTIQNAAVSGSKSHLDYKEADKTASLIWDTIMDVANVFKQTQDKPYMDILFLHAKEDQRSIRAAYLDFMKKHPASPVNSYLIQRSLPASELRSAGQVDSLSAIFNRFPAALKTGTSGKITAALLNKEIKSAIGHKAPSFTQVDDKGNTVSMLSLKGKYVLIHCWSSDKDADVYYNAALSNAYKSYAEKGLNIISVCLDSDKATFLASAGKRALPWPQVWDLKGAAGSVPQLYGVDSDRENILIDPNGTIIAKNVDSNELPKILAAILD